MLNNSLMQMKNKDLPLRLLLWGDLLDQISLKTFWGYGYDSYESLNPLFQSATVREIRSAGLAYAHNQYVPLIGHGHSDFLESLSEFGWVGHSLFTLPVSLLVIRNFLYSKSPLTRLVSMGCICFGFYCCLDFPTRTPVCLMTFSLLVGLSSKYAILTQSR